MLYHQSEEVSLPPTDPHKRLLAAMIERAILDLYTSDPKDREGAYRWLFDDQEELGLNFVFCCEMLEYDKDHIRATIRQICSPDMELKDVKKAITELKRGRELRKSVLGE